MIYFTLTFCPLNAGRKIGPFGDSPKVGLTQPILGLKCENAGGENKMDRTSINYSLLETAVPVVFLSTWALKS